LVGVEIASITSFIEGHQDWALVLMFVLLALESFGLPLPGETALIACSVLASQGTLQIEWVVLIGIAAAIIGDNLGYVVARTGGRKLLYKHRISRGYAEKYLPRGERFFARHGGKTVFIGRFVAVLRVTSAWTAGISRMHWWRFLGWNAAGGIVWATGVSLISYYLGDAAASAIGRYGLFAAGGALILTVAGYFVVRRIEERVMNDDDEK
jgi:membrane protein DedA with SNARE-associated domain